jgi:hypothetical protein
MHSSVIYVYIHLNRIEDLNFFRTDRKLLHGIQSCILYQFHQILVCVEKIMGWSIFFYAYKVKTGDQHLEVKSIVDSHECIPEDYNKAHFLIRVILK